MNDAIADAARRIAPISATPRLDAELLMAEALGTNREQLLLGDRLAPSPAGFAELAARRAAGEPLAYIVGRRAFWTIELEVGPGVLIPRPDSETLIEAAVAHFGAAGPASILDLGTGSGALLLAALDQWPQARGLGVDISPAALTIAARNAARLGFASRAAFRSGDWTEGLESQFELILCNPPYVEEGAALPPDVRGWEPDGALFAGKDGLDALRRLAGAIGPLLAEGGIACIEVGAGQAPAVCALLAAKGLKSMTRKDLGGHERCVIARL